MYDTEFKHANTQLFTWNQLIELWEKEHLITTSTFITGITRNRVRKLKKRGFIILSFGP